MQTMPGTLFTPKAERAPQDKHSAYYRCSGTESWSVFGGQRVCDNDKPVPEDLLDQAGSGRTCDHCWLIPGHRRGTESPARLRG